VWNVDVFGVLRGKYLTPAFAIRLGETAIRNCFRDQLAAIRKEGEEYMGVRPTIFTEIGIPYDMDDKYAYKTGDYSSQVAALDANHFAIEGCGAAGFTLWVYTDINNHRRGDQWNGEDLSIYSQDDTPLPIGSASSGDASSPGFSRSRSSEQARDDVTPATLKASLNQTDAMSSTPSSAANSAQALVGEDEQKQMYRAAAAYVRPYPRVVHGKIEKQGFDLRNGEFVLELDAPTSTPENLPTEIFLPDCHFPANETEVEVTGGKWTIGSEEGKEALKVLRWWHAAGPQKLTIKGVKGGKLMGSAEPGDEGYFEWLANGCALM
jgi:hypothetical protein